MTNNEKELLHIIHQHSNPEKAIEIAITTILDYLEQHGSFQVPSVVCSQESA